VIQQLQKTHKNTKAKETIININDKSREKTWKTKQDSHAWMKWADNFMDEASLQLSVTAEPLCCH